MSGGLDSTFVAWLLKKEGHHVEGITLHMVSEASEDPKSCCSLSAIKRAKLMCQKLGIPHTVLTVTDLFDATVIEDFTLKYSSGRTPNPCILCNRTIKFGYLLDRARRLGFDYIATGHYAVKKYDLFTGKFFLHQNKDAAKDQTYFLSTLTQDQIRHSLFPMAKFTKKHVRHILEREKLFAVSPRESQDICFLPADEDYRPFLKERLSPTDYKPGDFVNTKGEILGKHQGIPFYTIGQRKGLNISFTEPLYVVRMEKETNRIILGTRAEIQGKKFLIRHPNFSCHKGKKDLYSVKIRYRSLALKCRVSYSGEDRYEVELLEHGSAITPGQQAVFYRGDRMIGSGEII